jgi:hypothetical protein
MPRLSVAPNSVKPVSPRGGNTSPRLSNGALSTTGVNTATLSVPKDSNANAYKPALNLDGVNIGLAGKLLRRIRSFYGEMLFLWATVLR